MIPANIERIIVYLGTEKNEDLSKIHELTGVSESTISKILNKEFSLEEIDEMVNLRKKWTPLLVIAEKFKTYHKKVQEILKDELGNDYPKYHANKIKVSSKQINEMVRLRKERVPLLDIACKFKKSIISVRRILKEELKDDYDIYKSRRIPNSMKTAIFQLHKEGKTRGEIAHLTGVSITSIKSLVCSTFNVILDEIIENLQIEFHSKVKEDCILLFEKIHNKIRRGTKYRNLAILAPIFIFLFLRMKHANVNSKRFLNAANLSRTEFRNGLKYVQQNFSEYFVHNHKNIIEDNIDDITSFFNLNSVFQQEAMILLSRFLPYIKNTKEGIIASVVCTLTMIKLNITHIKCADVCKRSGISMSSVMYQVKHNILEKLGFSGFHGFQKSHHIIEQLLNVK